MACPETCEDGHLVGESWEAEDGCNTCSCTTEGVVCTELECLDDCEKIQAAYADLVAGAKACEADVECQALWGQCGVGLGGCYEVVNQSISQQELTQLGQMFNDAGCTMWVCDCMPPPLVTCDEGECAAIW